MVLAYPTVYAVFHCGKASLRENHAPEFYKNHFFKY